MLIKDKLTKKWAIFLIHDVPNKRYVADVFIKVNQGLKHATLSYSHKPSLKELLLTTENIDYVSLRPYKAGQSCDGSIGAPVFCLLQQLCNYFHIDLVAIYNTTYDDDILTLQELKSIIEFAHWQGVEIITKWNKEAILAVLESVTQINMHQLRNRLEELLP